MGSFSAVFQLDRPTSTSFVRVTHHFSLRDFEAAGGRGERRANCLRG